ncbi:MAG: helix-turn-helix transcriptional regulator [Treponema sp.]|jgi:transcriptional regulator with XRE-family HTH domain|nr:helix-turn-helix transcriptional regulator [Treponema sp.]
MMTIREILSRNLKENRQKLGLTQSELAERAGISTNFVAMIELKHKFPTPETLDRLSTALDINTYELFITSASPDSVLKRLHEDILVDMEKFHKKILGELDHTIDKAVDKALKKKKP